MTKAEFLVELEDILQRDEDEACQENDALAEYEEWDSLSKMSLMAFFKASFDLNLSMTHFEGLETVSDLIKLAGDNISD